MVLQQKDLGEGNGDNEKALRMPLAINPMVQQPRYQES